MAAQGRHRGRSLWPKPGRSKMTTRQVPTSLSATPLVL
jgi:hypothetical protein